MKLCCIVVVWDDWDLLKLFVSHMAFNVDGVIVVWSRMSNFGEVGESTQAVIWSNANITTVNHEPNLQLDPRTNETNKRNTGLQVARQMGYTHFLVCDTDEFYNPVEFKREKERFKTEPDLQGLVCELQTYFRHPTLTIGKDTTRIPFIHKLTPTIQHTFNRRYPFAWEGSQIRIDPTRSLNINSGVKMSAATMHHYSWVRKDYGKKIRNSTARANIERSQSLWDDIVTAKDGKLCKFYNKVLHTVPNYFHLPVYDELEIQDLQSIPSASAEKRANT